MTYITPNIVYDSISINGNPVELSSTCKASFTAPYNQIDITFHATNCSISYYEIRVTGIDDEYDIGVGSLAAQEMSIAQGKSTTLNIPVNATIFNKGDGLYRISLYGRSSVDGSWDVSYLFFTVVEGSTEIQQFQPRESDGLEVLTDRDPPTEKIM